MNVLDDLKKIKEIDVSGMLGIVSGLPEQCKDAAERASSIRTLPAVRSFKNIVFTGLGGSAIGADIVRVYLRKILKIPVVVNRNYTLPAFVDKDTLLFCCSYSGNTEETLSSFEDGVKRGASIITMGSGGKLKNFSISHKFVHIDIPGGLPPRTAIGYMSLTVIILLNSLGLTGDLALDIRALSERLVELRDKKIGPDVPAERNLSKQLAGKFAGRLVVIYGTSDTTEAVALRWRGQLAENSKSLASSHVLPEMNHNEIVGWDFPRNLLKDAKVVFLHDMDDHERIKRRIDISKDLIKRSGAEVFDVESTDGDLISRTFSLIYIGDFASLYLAVLNGIDPTPVKKIDYLKSQLLSGKEA